MSYPQAAIRRFFLQFKDPIKSERLHLKYILERSKTIFNSSLILCMICLINLLLRLVNIEEDYQYKIIRSEKVDID